MITSPRTAWLVGAATLWMPLYFLGFMITAVVLVLTRPGSGTGVPTGFVVLVVLHLFTILLGFALLAVYLVDVFRNPALADQQDQRVVWAVLVVVLNAFVMPVYWWLHLRPSSESFARRTSVSSA